MEYVFKSPEKLNQYLNTFDYGILYHGTKISNPTRKDFLYRYTTITPEDFFQYKIGICWDYVSAEKYYFNKYFKNISWVKTYYIELRNSTTHTFLIYKQDNKYFYFESSYFKYQGIYQFDTLDEIFDFVLNNMFKDDAKRKYQLYEYDINQFGLTANEFIKYIINHGSKLK